MRKAWVYYFQWMTVTGTQVNYGKRDRWMSKWRNRWEIKHCGKSVVWFMRKFFWVFIKNIEHFLPFWTLSQSRKISSPPFTLPLFLLTRQIRNSAVFGAPAEQPMRSLGKSSHRYSEHKWYTRPWDQIQAWDVMRLGISFSLWLCSILKWSWQCPTPLKAPPFAVRTLKGPLWNGSKVAGILNTL